MPSARPSGRDAGASPAGVRSRRGGAERGPDKSWVVDGRPETVRRQVHEALTDMGTDASELTYLRLVGDTPGAHQDVPLEESLGALVQLRDQGLIRRIGLSGALRRCWPAPSR
ncbi:aldo/keto reductase [Micromonospora sp. NPDC051543]|uniref:aldo/keto reductase n=1 Tax=Micromonospora sp. NPDC051543 TaxID=3364287 RepID=UPI0037A79DEA